MSAIVGVVKTAAPIAANMVLPGTGGLVSGLLDSVIKDNTDHTPEAIAAMDDETKAEIVSKNPEMLLALKTKAVEAEAAVNKEKTANMQQVAGVMQAELLNGKWYQRAWRPFNGFMFPIAVLTCYVVVPIWAYHAGALFVVEVPASLWMTWGGILGIATYGRNKEKAAQATPGLLGGNAGNGLIGGLLNRFTKK